MIQPLHQGHLAHSTTSHASIPEYLDPRPAAGIATPHILGRTLGSNERRPVTSGLSGAIGRATFFIAEWTNDTLDIRSAAATEALTRGDWITSCFVRRRICQPISNTEIINRI